jgi:peroxiredoxin Q/BCP
MDAVTDITSAPSANVHVDMLAPDFTLPMHPQGQFNLVSQRGHEVVVLYFYPEDDTPGCTAQACAFRDNIELFKEYGAGVYGVSQDPLASHQAFAEKFNLPFPLLIDEGGQVRQLYGMPDPKLEARARVTYIIDKDGIVRAILGADAERIPADQHVTDALEWVKKLADEEQSA